MDLERDVELWDRLEDKRKSLESALGEQSAGPLRAFRRALVERSLGHVHGRIERLKDMMAVSCDREISASGVPAQGLFETRSRAWALMKLAAQADHMAPFCTFNTPWNLDTYIEAFAKRIDDLDLKTRIRLIDHMEGGDPSESDLDTTKMTRYLKLSGAYDDLPALAGKLESLSELMEDMAMEDIDLCWELRRQIVSMGKRDLPAPVVEAVGRVTGTQVKRDAVLAM